MNNIPFKISIKYNLNYTVKDGGRLLIIYNMLLLFSFTILYTHVHVINFVLKFLKKKTSRLPRKIWCFHNLTH